MKVLKQMHFVSPYEKETENVYNKCLSLINIYINHT